jgi:hypothetical protein
MIVIGNVIISDDLNEEFFACDLGVCQGACCVQGEKGAPLEHTETTILTDEYDRIQLFLTDEGIRVIEQRGTHTVDEDGTLRTPLTPDGSCAYAVFENGSARCGIEKAYEARRTSLRKPISCHLYPVRINRHGTFDAVNYHRWEICAAACSLGQYLKIPIYTFVKDALIRKYGDEFYQTLEGLIQSSVSMSPTSQALDTTTEGHNDATS